MKNVAITICVTISLIVAMPFIINTLSPMNKTIINSSNQPLEGSTEQLYQDIFMSLLMPSIDKAVYNYYGPHRGVGVDRINISVGGTGTVKVEKFEHIKTFYIPPNPTRP